MTDDASAEVPQSVISQHIAETLRRAILRGELAPGDRIRQEELAARFRASRFPVREALRILETGGLVTLHANRGAWVVKLTQAECIELYKVREQLEPLLIEQSVDRLDDALLAEIDRLRVVLEDPELPVEDYLDLDRRFHLLTYAGSSMPAVLSLIERLLDVTNYYRRAYYSVVHSDTERSWTLAYDHRLIVDALQRRDGREAAIVMGLHTRRARLGLQQHPAIFAAEDGHRAAPDLRL